MFVWRSGRAGAHVAARSDRASANGDDTLERYGALLEQLGAGIADERTLPAAKPVLKAAVKAAWFDRTERFATAPLELWFLSLANFQPGVGALPVFPPGASGLAGAGADETFRVLELFLQLSGVVAGERAELVFEWRRFLASKPPLRLASAEASGDIPVAGPGPTPRSWALWLLEAFRKLRLRWLLRNLAGVAAAHPAQEGSAGRLRDLSVERDSAVKLLAPVVASARTVPRLPSGSRDQVALLEASVRSEIAGYDEPSDGEKRAR